MMSHVEALTDEQFSELFSTIMALHTQERNRFFFVASSSSSGTMHPHYARLVDMLNCLMLQMPPLRSHLQDIPRLVWVVYQYPEYAQRPCSHRF